MTALPSSPPAAEPSAQPSLPPSLGPFAEPLPRASQQAMLAAALLQGLAAYALTRDWPLTSFGGLPLGALQSVGLSLVLAWPGFFLLCVTALRQRRLWQLLAGLALLLLGLNASVWWMSGAVAQWPGAVWLPWALCQSLLLLMALAWAQAWLQRGSLRGLPYALLFGHAWNNALALAFALLFASLAWALLGLWAGLFSLVKVSLFAWAFSQPLFIYSASALLIGVGVLLARGQPRPLRVMLQLLLALCRLLLPLLALVLLLFVAFLPFTGLQPLWQTRHAAPLLMGVLLWLMLLVNAVYQDGSQAQAAYAPVLRALVSAALGLMPLLAALALWAVALRVRQYGWTHERVWAAAAALVLLLYALGYGAAAWPRRRPWLALLAPVNRGLSWGVMALLVLLHTPLLDPYRIGAHSQRERLAQGQQLPTLQALQSLRFDHGRHGLAALQSLQGLPRFASAAVQQDMQQALQAQERRWSPSLPAGDAPLQALIAVAPGQPAPADDWWQALQQPALRSDLWACQLRPQAAVGHTGSAAAGVALLGSAGMAAPVDSIAQAAKADCVALQLALDAGDEQPRQLLCRVGSGLPSCLVYGRDEQGRWQRQGQIRWGGLARQEREQLVQALRAGLLRTRPARWHDVAVPGADSLPPGRME